MEEVASSPEIGSPELDGGAAAPAAAPGHTEAGGGGVD